MSRSVSTAFDWMMIVGALGLLLYVLVSPTGSFVRAPMGAAQDVAASAAAGDFLAIEAAAAVPVGQ